MPRKSKAQIAEEAAAAAAAARPFAHESTAPFAAQSDEARLEIARSIARDKRSGFSGNELRAKYGERLTGPARRRILRDADEASGTIARSYTAYRDTEPRSGSRHASQHGARAEERRAAARDEAQQALADARKAPKGRSKASKAQHAATVAECEARLAAIG